MRTGLGWAVRGPGGQVLSKNTRLVLAQLSEGWVAEATLVANDVVDGLAVADDVESHMNT
jgi:hypothetical protein